LSGIRRGSSGIASLLLLLLLLLAATLDRRLRVASLVLTAGDCGDGCSRHMHGAPLFNFSGKQQFSVASSKHCLQPATM
jgi:hypothetical protein